MLKIYAKEFFLVLETLLCHDNECAQIRTSHVHALMVDNIALCIVQSQKLAVISSCFDLWIKT
jgi:hypothetical protein